MNSDIICLKETKLQQSLDSQRIPILADFFSFFQNFDFFGFQRDKSGENCPK